MTTPSFHLLPLFAAWQLLLISGVAVAQSVPCDESARDIAANALAKPARFEITDRSPNLLPAPLIAPWKVVPLDPNAGGAWVVTGDLDGDGEIEVVSAQNMLWTTGPHYKGDVPIQYASSVSVQKLDGRVLWTWGNPGKGRRELSHDVACQVYDWDGDGKNEVVVIGRDALAVLEGATGKPIKSFPIPPGASDCVIAADLAGSGHPRDFILKDRYLQMWGMRSDGKILWESNRYSGITGSWHLGHRPLPVDVNGDGRDDVFAGFFMINSDGAKLWDVSGVNNKKTIFVHMDSNAIIRHGGSNPADWRFAFTYCSGLGIGLVNGNGEILKEATGHHYEAISSGRVFPDAKLPHLLLDVDHLPAGQARVELFDADLNLMGRINLDYGRFHKLVDWDGDVWDEIVIAEHGAVYNHLGGKTATLDLEGQRGRVIQTGNFSGAGRRDILIVGNKMDKVFLFKNPAGENNPDLPLGTGRNYTNY
jgi:hypothetical protein